MTAARAVSRLWRTGVLLVLFAGSCGDRRQLSLFAPSSGDADADADAGAGARGDDGGDHDSERSRRCDGVFDCTDERPFCESAEHRCVECLTSDDCHRGESCRFEDHACVPTCSSVEDCVGGGRPICSVSAGICVECTGPGNCRDSKPICNLRTGQCVECIYDDDCNDSEECYRGECQR